MDELYETVKLEYSVHKYSSFSGSCTPENVLVDQPTNQVSRWFTDSNLPDQYIMLKLQSPCIVESITFGKYMKAHVSDLKKFQVFGGMEEMNLSLLLSAGLKNDNCSEVFSLRYHTNDGFFLPILYIKIVPLQSWGPPHNYTIWYVALHGKNQNSLMTDALQTIHLRKEEETVRILLKHLRRRCYKDAFAALSRESGVRLEGQTQTRLWDALVEKADYEQAERIFDEAANNGELDWYVSWHPYTPQWQQISACSAQVEERLSRALEPLPASPPPPADLVCNDRDWSSFNGNGTDNGDSPCTISCSCKPGPRGGHQLVLDSSTSTLYLFGGWNGTEDLDDLWSYDIGTDRWSLICANSGVVGGPSPRSCHKMVFDPVHRRLFTLGRYLDSLQRQPNNMKSELYVYEITTNEWRLVCDDTAKVGGPRLVFDHQMCIDSDTQTIYVFGGRVVPVTSDESAQPLYSGLYAYYIHTDTWQLLLSDHHEQDAPQPRVGHSMLFHPVRRRLYIFAGQRDKQLLPELWWWDVATRACGAVAVAAARAPPAAGFTQRATLDPDLDEMFVLSGMSKEKEKRVFNTLWVFSFRRLTWSLVYRNDRASPADPRPRFAHQLVYDHHKKVHYLFGGTPGNRACPRLRLDDLWALRLSRPGAASLFAGARLALRVARFRALAADRADRAAAPRALAFLRRELHDALDHADPAQARRFRSLATELFAARPPPSAPRPLSAALAARLARRRARLAAPQPPPARAIAAVLGAGDCPAAATPFEEPPGDEPREGAEEEGEGEGEEGEGEGEGEWDAWAARARRERLFEELCRVFPPSCVPPRHDIAHLFTL